MKLKKKENKGGDGSDKTSGNIGGSTLAVFFFIFMFGLALIPGGSAKAYTAYVSACDLQEPPFNCGEYSSIFNFNLDKSNYTPGEPIVLNASVEHNNGGLSFMDIYALPEWGDTQQQLFGYSDFASAYFEAPAYSSNVIIDGNYSFSGYLCCGPTYTSFPWSLPVTVSAPVAPPAAPTVTVYANEQTPSTTINYNQGATIRWTTSPVTSCSSCTYTSPTKSGSCPGFSGQPSGEFYLPDLTSNTVINIVCGNTTGGTSSSCVGTVAGSMINGVPPGPYEGESCSQFTTQGDCLQGWLTHGCSWR